MVHILLPGPGPIIYTLSFLLCQGNGMHHSLFD